MHVYIHRERVCVCAIYMKQDSHIQCIVIVSLRQHLYIEIYLSPYWN